jgi:hypothetical protein
MDKDSIFKRGACGRKESYGITPTKNYNEKSSELQAPLLKMNFSNFV